MPAEVLVVFCTFPDPATAREISEAAIREKLAACCHLISGGQSIYWWKGKIESVTEVFAILKTTSASYSSLEQFLQKRHPYEVPEIVAFPLEHGYLPYLDWVAATCPHPTAAQ